MSKHTNIKSILVLGAGLIVIGQTCKFDYFGTQARKVLREEGYRIILANSNPVTIMTDPAMTDATYIEPIKWVIMAEITEKERPDALLLTMGGQTALNCALDLKRHGVLERFDVEMIGINIDTIDKTEDRSHFDKTMKDIGLACLHSGIAHGMEEAYGVLGQIGFSCITRLSLIMGGTGGGIACNREEFEEICARGPDLSPANELLINGSLTGWREYGMEMVRDKKDNCIIICSIEGLNPMGVHTDDLITMASTQTLTGKEYQIIHDASLAVSREIGVETGGSNVQLDICPNTGCMVVTEVNPRISCSLALTSKTIGFPIAKIAAKLVVDYTPDELQSDIAGGRTSASFEPAIDYVVTKIPRFASERFPKAGVRLTTRMESVDGVMVIDRTFQESVQKALRGLEVDAIGPDPKLDLNDSEVDSILKRELTVPSAEHVWYVADVFRIGKDVGEVFELIRIDEWFLVQIEDLVKDEEKVKALGLSSIDRELMYKLKRKGFSDVCLTKLLGVTEKSLRSHRHKLKALPVYKRVDTRAAELATNTAYVYSTYEEECEANPSSREKIMIFDGDPGRIDQGIEFDCCRVHAVLTIHKDDCKAITVNCSPGTVSTNYDISDRLYFEPVTLRDVPEIVRVKQPKGVTIQYDGQTPLKLCHALEGAGVLIIGISPDIIDRVEDRERFRQMVQHLSLRQPAGATARSEDKALATSKAIGYPLVVRPSYVLGGWAMEIVYQGEELKHYMREAVQVSNDSLMLLNHFLNCAIEVSIGAVCDGEVVVIDVIMQHIEQAGAHFGGSVCPLSPYSLSQHIQGETHEQAKKTALELGVIGLMNIWMVVQGEDIFAIEVSPCASRIMPFASKCVGGSLAEVAARTMTGEALVEVSFTQEVIPPFFSVKETMFPFTKFPSVDPILGPEMKSTGEVMGVGDSFAEAFARAQSEANEILPTVSRALVSVREDDKPFVVQVAGNLAALDSEVVATAGITRAIEAAGLPVRRVNKMTEGRPYVMDMIKNDEVTLIINTTEGRQSVADLYSTRRDAPQHEIYCTTAITGGQTVYEALKLGPEETVRRLQGLRAGIKT